MNILIVTSAKFPEGDAEAVRLHIMGSLFKSIGHNVTYAGMGFSDYLDRLQFDGFEYVSLRKKANNKCDKIYYYFNYKSRLKKYILSYLRLYKIDIILFADLSPMNINMLKRLCKTNGIKLITDSVEWYSPEQFKYGALSPAMILKNIENKYTVDKSIKVITISKYLNKHFINKGCNCLRIPVILDVKNISCEKIIDIQKLTIIYAGSPGKKDYVDKMLRGILLLNENEISKLRFELAGVSLNDIKNLFTSDELSKLNKCVIFLGRIERKEVLEKLSKADFTVLLRSPYQRYAKAGFPTKVVESLSTATPVILNLTSDLGDYINDMEEGLIVDDCSAIAFCKALKRGLELDIEKREHMRRSARICAENYFDYRLYTDKIRSFIS